MRRIGAVGVTAFAATILLAATWLFLPFPGTSDVQSFWLPWMRNLEAQGLVAGYAANAGDYPPGTAVILWITLHLGQAFGADHFTALKWSLFICLGASSVVVWLWTRRLLLVAAFHLALLPQSLALGYVDVYSAPALLVSLWALGGGRPVLFSCCFAIASLTKWQPLILAPFLLVYALDVRDLRPWRSTQFRVRALHVIAPGLALGLVAVGFFGVPLVHSLRRALSHDYLSGYALNFPWVITHWIRAYNPDAFGGLVNGQADFITTDDLRYVLLPRLLFLGFYAAAFVLEVRRPKTFPNVLRLALVGYLAYFTFNTGVHENHLFLAVIVGFIVYWHDRSHAPTAAAIALVSNVNLMLFYGVSGTGYPFSRLLAGVDVAVVLAAAVTVFFVAVFAVVAGQTESSRNPESPSRPG